MSTASGSCLCGAVTYTVEGPLRPVVACHCSQCRKQTGHFYAATSCAADDLDVADEGEMLSWYRASDGAGRGFCSHCGSALFWKRDGSPNVSILAGSLDDEGGVRLDRHIFVADKGDYYEIADGLPTFPQAD